MITEELRNALLQKKDHFTDIIGQEKVKQAEELKTNPQRY